MKKKFISYLFSLFLLSLPCYSDITVTVGDKLGPGGAFSGFPDIQNNINAIAYDFSISINTISSFVSDSFSLATVNSTPIGVKKINNLSLGLSINPAVSFDKLKFYEDMGSGAAGALPKIGAGINISIFFGISLGKRFDLFISAIYLPKETFNLIKYKPEGFDISILSGGLKLRYSLVSEDKLKKNEFAGITVSPGIYCGYNTLTYNKSLNQSTEYDTGVGILPPPPPPPAPQTYTGKLILNNIDMNVKVIVISFDLEIMFYFNFFKVINVFAGFGGTLNLSYLKMNAIVNVSNQIDVLTDTDNISLAGDAKGSKIIPRIVFGTEINLYVRILIQGVVSWSKGQGLFGGTFAFRFEF